MTQAELWLIEEGWKALVERLGVAEATRFVMLLDRRTGSGLQHLQHMLADVPSQTVLRSSMSVDQPRNRFDSN